MKTKLLFGAALLFSVAAFAQSPRAEKRGKNSHGSEVSAVAKSEMEAGAKGDAVSSTASSKSQASVNVTDNTSEARAHRKADREAAREARKQDQRDFVADVKAEAEARKDEGQSGVADVRAEAEARKELLKETKEEAKAAREAAKAERKAADGAILDADAKVKIGKSDRKPEKATRPAKVNGGAKAGADVQLSRPKVGAKVRGTAGLGIL